MTTPTTKSGVLVCLAAAGCIALAGCQGCSAEPSHGPAATQSAGDRPAGPASATQPGPPVVQVGGGTEGECDLGRVPAGSKHTVMFTVANPTDQPLVFRHAQGDCECIAAKDPPKEIAPRSSVTITVSYEAPTPATEYKSALVILTTNPQRKVISLYVKSSPP